MLNVKFLKKKYLNSEITGINKFSYENNFIFIVSLYLLVFRRISLHCQISGLSKNNCHITNIERNLAALEVAKYTKGYEKIIVDMNF